MKARAKLKRQVQNRWTDAQYRALETAMSSPEQWQALTDHLSRTQGDPDELSVRKQQAVQRIDRAIRQYEEGNDRQHTIYANVELPPNFDTSKLTTYPAVHLDRWTAGSHNLHEVSADAALTDNTYVLEINTRRGMYWGQSDGGTRASHLLPRGMNFTVDEVYEARWRDKTGKTGTRRVIRLQEIDQEG